MILAALRALTLAISMWLAPVQATQPVGQSVNATVIYVGDDDFAVASGPMVTAGEQGSVVTPGEQGSIVLWDTTAGD